MPRSKQAQDFFYTEDLDLTDEQIAQTQQTYIRYAENYAKNYERVPDILKTIKPLTLDPFISHYKTLHHNHAVLFMGCGSGRDMEYFQKKGIHTYGIDISKPLLDIARRYNVEAPLEIMDLLNINFEEDSFSGVFCETALSHVKKSDLKRVLENIYSILKPNGIAHVAFRWGNGKVYYTKDKVGGLRYNTSMTQEESDEYIKQSKLEIILKHVEENSISTRPPFIEYLLIKKI